MERMNIIDANFLNSNKNSNALSLNFPIDIQEKT